MIIQKQMDKNLTQDRRSHAEAVILGDVVDLIVRVDGVVIAQLQHLFESIIDEDETDETRETFLSEAGEILH